ncbi:MAG: toxin-antitoxin system HicB family antitoxin [Deltaproteobacteria bacterium]|nr:toxin-antitoxin system HicB family antitoxin [Deltaproteobacteria bacterium]
MADGPTPEAATKEAKKAAKLWIEAAKKEKREIPEPIDKRRYSGKFVVRVPPELQREQASEEGEIEGAATIYLL